MMQDYSLEQRFMSEPVYPTEFPTSAESCPSSSISPVSSYASFTEETYLVDELKAQGSISPFTSPLHHMNVFCSEEDMGFQGLDWQIPRYVNTPINGTNNLCSLVHILFSTDNFHVRDNLI